MAQHVPASTRSSSEPPPPPRRGARRTAAAALLLLLLLLGGCSRGQHGDQAIFSAHGAAAKIARDPYAGVDWEHDTRLLTQFHEQVRTQTQAVQSMDDAGYQAIGLMGYSGVASLAYTAKERYWPPENFLPPEFIAGLKHIKLFFPNAEEVGFDHITSPFLTSYIAKWEPDYYPQREAWHYASAQEAIDRIHDLGGLAFIAHPWRSAQAYTHMHGFAGMEIYNAYCRHKFEIKNVKVDKNATLRHNWDAVLRDNPAVLGVGVNDWFGASSQDPQLRPETRDSGKTIVLVKQVSLDGLRQAVERGAALAVQDFGVTKGQLPQLRAIAVSSNAIHVELAPDPPGEVRWVADGKPLPQPSATLELSRLVPATHYVRAEIVGADGSTTFTQAWGLKWTNLTAPAPEDEKLETDKRHRRRHR